jgi:hypothetical protein
MSITATAIFCFIFIANSVQIVDVSGCHSRLSGILLNTGICTLKTKKDSGQAGMTDLKILNNFQNFVELITFNRDHVTIKLDYHFNIKKRLPLVIQPGVGRNR